MRQFAAVLTIFVACGASAQQCPKGFCGVGSFRQKLTVSGTEEEAAQALVIQCKSVANQKSGKFVGMDDVSFNSQEGQTIVSGKCLIE